VVNVFEIKMMRSISVRVGNTKSILVGPSKGQIRSLDKIYTPDFSRARGVL
jgi:hypothetical protein